MAHMYCYTWRQIWCPFWRKCYGSCSHWDGNCIECLSIALKVNFAWVCCRQKQQMLSKWWCICSAAKKKLRLKNIYTLCGVWLRVWLSLSLGFGGWLNDWDVDDDDDDDVGGIQRPTLISWIIQKIDRSSDRFLDS